MLRTRTGLFRPKENKPDSPKFNVKALGSQKSAKLLQHFNSQIACNKFFFNAAGINEISDTDNLNIPQKIKLSNSILSCPSERYQGRYDFYVFEDEIGKGQFGDVVKLAGKLKCNENGELEFKKIDSLACKIFKIGTEFTIEDIQNEAAIAKVTELNAKDLIIIERLNKAFLIQDLIIGQTLFNFVSQIQNHQRIISFEERENLWEELIFTIMKLHHLEIIHGDIQPDNLIISQRNGLYEIHLVDHGFSHFVKKPHCRQFQGTMGYTDPEIIEGKMASFASDIFSTGIVGSLFFNASTPEILQRDANPTAVLLSAKNYDFPGLFSNLEIPEVSRSGFKMLLDGMVTDNIDTRLKMDEIWEQTQNTICNRRLELQQETERQQYEIAFKLATRIRVELLSSKNIASDLVKKIDHEVNDEWPSHIYQMFCMKLHEPMLLGSVSKNEILMRLNSLIAAFETYKSILSIKVIDLKMLPENSKVKRLLDSSTAILSECEKSLKNLEQIKRFSAKLNKYIEQIADLSVSFQPASERSSSIRASF